MAITEAVAPSGDPLIDSLAWGRRWSLGSLSYSFPDSSLDYHAEYYDGIPFNNFAKFNAQQQEAVRQILGQVSAFTPLSFVEFSAAADSNAELRFGRTDARQTASAFFPEDFPESGDVWVNNSSGIYDAPVRGRYAYVTLIHEIGHALGLRHGHEAPALPADVDTLEYTVMTYRSYVGAATTSYRNESNSYPQTFMSIDIAALQYLYGANFATNSGNTVYSWSPLTGAFSIDGAVQWTPAANRVLMTVWDGNGVDTYDFSAYSSDLIISLMPGAASTMADQRAFLGDGQFARGNVWNAFLHQGDTRSLIENATGGSGNDILIGNTAANQLRGGAGDDRYHVDSTADSVIELAGAGTDEVLTALGSRVDFTALYTLPANVEKLTGTSAGAQGVFANALDNIVAMGAGGDLVVLHDGGVDSVAGGGGNDFIYYGAAFTTADSSDGGAGFDTVGLLGSYTIIFSADDLVSIEKLAVYSAGSAPGAVPNSYDLTMIDANVGAGASLMVVALSLAANELLSFNGAAEANGTFNIRGGKGNDVITAGGGNDQVYGNLGADTLRGGAGNDLFEYYAVAESAGAAVDGVLDFRLGDRFNLSVIDPDGNAANGNGAFAFIGSSDFHNVAGELRAALIDPAGIWVIQGDVNGDGLADFEIFVTVADLHPLTAGDFNL